MDKMLNNIGDTLSARINVYNAMNVAIRALEENVDLDYPAARLARALGAADYAQAAFGFDVLNKMCGDTMPRPAFMSAPNCPPPTEMVNSDGSLLSYTAKTLLAADMLSSTSKINKEILRLYAKAIAAATAKGHTALGFMMLLPILYPTPAM